MRQWKNTLLRLAAFFAGLFVMSFGYALVIKAGLGVGAWDVLHIGLRKTLGLTVGTWAQIVGLAIIAAVVLMTRRLPSYGAVLNMFFVGWFMDLGLFLLPTPHQLGLQVVFLLVGLCMSGFGAGMYISAEVGTGPRDWFLLVLNQRTGWSIRKVKTTMELTVMALGWWLGGPVSLGTLAAALLMGPLMQKGIQIWRVWMTYLVGRDGSDEGINQGQVWLDHHDGVGQSIR